MKAYKDGIEISPSPEWWQECYYNFFGVRPVPDTASGYLAVLSTQPGIIVHFAVIEKSNNHSEAHQRALQEYADLGHPAESDLRCIVYGPCRRRNCRCAGEGCAMEFTEQGDTQ